MLESSALQPRFYRPTWMEINLDSLSANFWTLKKRLPAATKVLAAVKANAYGHGIVEVSRRLVDCGVDYLGVACIDEALLLRKNHIPAPILHLGAFLKGDIEAIIDSGITVTVTDLGLAKRLNAAGKRAKRSLKVHVKIDTGMGRLGVWHKQADDFVLRLCALDNLIIEGIYSHFPSADSDEEFTRSQILLFRGLIHKLKIKGLDIPLKHLANSMAVLGFKDSYFNLVRPGLSLYGLHPKDELLNKIGLKPALSFKTRVAFLKKVQAGRGISYGRTFVTARQTTIATLPVGYGDGYNRLLSNKGKVLIRGRLYPVAGAVCMDQTMIDAGNRGDARLGDEVVLIGSQGAKSIAVEEVARLCRTIPYEVVCWLSPRVPRVYIQKIYG